MIFYIFSCFDCSKLRRLSVKEPKTNKTYDFPQNDTKTKYVLGNWETFIFRGRSYFPMAFYNKTISRHSDSHPCIRFICVVKLFRVVGGSGKYAGTWYESNCRMDWVSNYLVTGTVRKRIEIISGFGHFYFVPKREILERKFPKKCPERKFLSESPQVKVPKEKLDAKVAKLKLPS